MLVLVPAQVMATHNSVAVDLEITRADEVDPETGQLDPDLEEDTRIWNYTQRYHFEETEGTPAPERIGPQDQSGQHYNPEDCRPYEEFEASAEGSQTDHYEAALPGVDSDIDEEKDACWIGLLDDQVEYMLTGNLLGEDLGVILFGSNYPGPEVEFGAFSTHCLPCLPTKTQNPDPLYFANPEASDSDCEQPDTRDQCAQKSHTAYWPAYRMANIDTDYLEAGLGSEEDNPTPTSVAGATGTSQGSGTMTLPLLFTYKTFLYGYSHPTTTPSEEIASDIDQPLWGVPSNACGVVDPSGDEVERTPSGDDCRLLTPDDLAAYDTNHELSDDISEEDAGRLCDFTPQYVTVNPDDAGAGPCGVFGHEITPFYETTEGGGFGTGTVNTYQATLPGYKAWFVVLGSSTLFAPLDWEQRFGTENTTGQQDQYYGASTSEALLRTVAVNPVVPSSNDPANCVRPNIKSDGTQINDAKAWDAEEVAAEFDDMTVAEAEAIGELSAPGIYGNFLADAIDNDAYANSLNGLVQSLYTGEGVEGYDGYRETFGDVLGTGDDAAGDALSTAGNVLQQAGDAVPDEAPGQDVVDDTTEQTNDIRNRLQTGQAADPEPAAEAGYEAGYEAEYESFTDEPEVDEGLTCQGASLTLVEQPDSVTGYLRHDAQLDRSALSIEDPTILDEEGLPANKSNTSEGAWHTEAYSFSGPLVGYFDKGGDEGFDGCDPADGQPSPGLDDCAWIPLWDAYNPGCTAENEETVCADILAEDGYDVGPDESNVDLSGEPTPHGVGMVATVELTGTTLLTNQPDVAAPEATADNSQIINQDPTARTCVVITSQGFDEYLHTHIDGASDFESATDALCTDEADQVVTIPDGFENQGAPDAPSELGFTSTVSWVPLIPTPDAARTAADIGDQRLCVSAVFSTQQSVLGADGTSDTHSTVNLGHENTETYYTDCDVISQELQDGEATAHTGFEQMYHDFPVDAHLGVTEDPA